VPVPFDVDGQHVYRVIPGAMDVGNGRWDNDALLRFLRQISDAGIPTLKYDMERISDGSVDEDMMHLVIEGYDSARRINLKLSERIKAAEFPERMDIVKRMMSSVGLALVRHELTASTGV
jgi:hypothetical protein